jgi:hypothetical protein
MSAPISTVSGSNDVVINPPVATESSADQDVEMNNCDDGLSVSDSVEVIKDAIRQASAQIAKMTIQLVTPGVLSEEAAKKLRGDLALRQKDLKLFKESLLAMEESLGSSAASPASASLGPTKSTMLRTEFVPNDLPIIQWVGMVSDNKSTIFTDLRTCLSRFEVVVECHGLDLDVNGARLLKYCCLNEDHQTFLKETFFVPGVAATWSIVKDAFLKKFGVNASVDRSTAANELMAITKRSTETIEQYIDRFNALRRRADLNDSFLLISTFLRGLPDSFQERMAYTMNMGTETQTQNLEYVCAVARNLDSRLASMRANKRTGDDQRESLGTKKSKVSDEPSSSSFPNGAAASKYASKPSSSSSTREKKGSFCSFHRSTTHSTDSCRAAKLGGVPKPGPGDCRRCGAKNWNPSHRCDSSAAVNGVGKSASNLVMRAMSTSPERFSSSASRITTTTSSAAPRAPVSTTVETNTSVASSAGSTNASSSSAVAVATQRINDMDISDEESLLVAAQAQACKYHKRFSLPPRQISNSLFVPAIIENITTYSLIDSGSSFSMVTPEFFNSLVPPIPLVKQEGTIQLGHVNNAISRIGSCTLKVFYNKKSFYHTFEVFPFFTHEDVPICFGLDILPQLNIGITGLVSSHFEQIGH